MGFFSLSFLLMISTRREGDPSPVCFFLSLAGATQVFILYYIFVWGDVLSVCLLLLCTAFKVFSY